jgi:hypothetical protein
MTEKTELAIMEFCQDNGIDSDEVIEKINDKDIDFEIDNYRFIHKDVIDDIMCREMSGDAYVLGCHNAWFIAENTDLPINIIEALQKADEFEAIGQYIIDTDFVEAMQQGAVSYDGYGLHFAHYDNNEIEDLLNVCGYYVFRVN